MPSVEDELRRLAAQVRLWISRRKMRVKDIEANLGWKSGHMSKILGGHSKMKVADFFLILAAIQVDPAEFFHDFYRLGSGHEFPMAVSDRLRQPGTRCLPPRVLSSRPASLMRCGSQEVHSPCSSIRVL